MARTEQGDRLTEAHRQGQLQIRARTLRDFMLLWPLWTGDEASFQRLLAAAMPLIRGYHGVSSSLATAYYTAFRSAEDVGGSPTPVVAAPLDEKVVKGTLHLTGMEALRAAVEAAKPPAPAMRTALARTSGSVTRFTMQGGRDALIRSVGDDRRAEGWYRVTSGKACAFCAALASRGAVYKEQTAHFDAHDHCSCSAEPLYRGSALPPSADAHLAEYNAAQRWARENPDQAASGTSNDLLNNFRRYRERGPAAAM